MHLSRISAQPLCLEMRLGTPLCMASKGLMPKGSEDLLAFVNDFLAMERKTGRLDVLAEKYIFAEGEDTLDRVVILSRHNIRSPLSGSGSLLGDITPHEWFQWTSNPSELSLRGAVLETLMGQYFRLWLEQEGFSRKIISRKKEPSASTLTPNSVPSPAT